MLLLLLNLSFPLDFGLSGLILPKRPPCFAIPFFEAYRELPSTELPRTVFIQDVCDSQLTAFAKCELDESIKTVAAKHIRTLSLDSGEYDVSHFVQAGRDSPIFITGVQRLYAFVETQQIVRVGHIEPLRRRLANSPLSQLGSGEGLQKSEFTSESNCFTKLELARFEKNRSKCLNAVSDCFSSIEQHSRTLAVHWLKMTKDSLKSEKILESTD